MTMPPDLLDILRCPYCVTGQNPRASIDPGRLELAHGGEWLVCLEPDCRRKYPIREDVPVMLIEEGSKWVDTAVEKLPQPGRLV